MFTKTAGSLFHNQEKINATAGCDKYELGFPERLDKLLLKIENAETLLIKIMKYICSAKSMQKAANSLFGVFEVSD